MTMQNLVAPGYSLVKIQLWLQMLVIRDDQILAVICFEVFGFGIILYSYSILPVL